MANSLIVDQAPVLGQPSEHAAKSDYELDAIVDLDEGDSLLDGKPDDGSDTTGKDETEVEASEPEPEVEEDSGEVAEPVEDEEPEETPEKPVKLSGSARLKAKLAEAQAEIERLRNAVPQVDNAKALSDAVEREIGPAPREEDYSDYLQFTKAETAYETMKMMVSRELRKNAEAAKNQIELHNNTIVETFKERAVMARKELKDFDAVVQAATVSPSHQDTIMLILESEKGPQLSYYLSKHPEKVHELNAMPARKQAAEIGRLEAQLSKSRPKDTKAPAPVPPLRGSSKIEKVDPESMDMKSFAAWYDAQKSKRD
jgi:uncharacterized small protein (DUF1192 family)